LCAKKIIQFTDSLSQLHNQSADFVPLKTLSSADEYVSFDRMMILWLKIVQKWVFSPHSTFLIDDSCGPPHEDVAHMYTVRNAVQLHVEVCFPE